VLRARFTGQPEHVINFFFFIAEQMRQHMAKLGFRTVDEMVGRVDKIDAASPMCTGRPRASISPRSSTRPRCPRAWRAASMQAQDHGLGPALDHALIAKAAPALESQTPVTGSFAIRNVHRTVGAMLGGEIARRYGSAGLPDGTIHFKFQGSAGQSFGAFVPNGVTLELEGDANDYLGKGSPADASSPIRPRPPASCPRKASSSATSFSTAQPAAKSSSTASPASALPSATPAQRRWSKAWATTAANT
jgi:glutamate synthase (NADPH) large chain